MIRILGIETSCDDSSLALLHLDSNLRFDIPFFKTVSQAQIHEPFGGVIPELASRSHFYTVNHLLQELIESSIDLKTQIDAIAVTNRPGLIGGLFVGVGLAKTLAYVLKKPLIPIHHLEGHIASMYFQKDRIQNLELPICVAVVSGGHTSLYLVTQSPFEWPEKFLQLSLLGSTRDDAAGEAFDKAAKKIGFPYPGGPWIDKIGSMGNPHKYLLPRAYLEPQSLDFSFSGLKTAFSLLVDQLTTQGLIEQEKPHLCAGLQEAVVDVLIEKISRVVTLHGCKSVGLVGGVACNSRLRAQLTQFCEKTALFLSIPEKQYCTDNAAMIALAGAFRFIQKKWLTVDESLLLTAYAMHEY